MLIMNFAFIKNEIKVLFLLYCAAQCSSHKTYQFVYSTTY